MAISQDRQAICAPAVFDGNKFLTDHCVLLHGSDILDVLPISKCPTDYPLLELDAGILAPGLIDLQVNGGGGVLFNEQPTPEGAQVMAAAHRKLGTTSILPTVISDEPSVAHAAAEAVKKCREEGHTGIAGLHLEGPFFAPAKRGAHSEKHLCTPTKEDINWLCSLSSLPLVLTLAPECVDTEDIERLSQAGVIVCAGHTNASAAQLKKASDAGLQGVTHLYNAMSSPTAREPGVVGGTLASRDIWAGIIADGHHVHPDNITSAFRAKLPGKLILVSDAMATVGSPDRTFTLYGEKISEREGRLVNADGVLAGSAISLMDAVRYANSEVKLPLEDCLRMASLFPADILGLSDRLGRIASGYRADLVHFDENFCVFNTWLSGRHEKSYQDEL